MIGDRAFVVAVLAAALVLFAWGRWRYDAVALLTLLVLTIAGIIPAGEAFAGFGHPAVVTVAAILVITRGLQNSGLVDLLARWLGRAGARPTSQVAANAGLVAVLSAFMNNVGALALLLPVSIRVARSKGFSPSLLLMPLSFGSLLGGLMTLVGTPPNIIVATYRGERLGEPFRMFDFTPVGAGLALAGVVFVTLVGWRLIPRRDSDAAERLFEVSNYVTEFGVPDGASLAGRPLREVGERAEGAVVVGLVRGDRRIPAPSGFELLHPGDILIVQADSDAITALATETGLEPAGSEDLEAEALGSDEVVLTEAVVVTGAMVVGRTARDLDMRWRYGTNLVAISRHGTRLRERVGNVRLRPGDVLLLQAPRASMRETFAVLGLLPLAERGLQLARAPRIATALALFGGALLASGALGLVPIQVALAAAALGMGAVGLVSLRQAYEAIDWPVLILLGAMLPVGGALETTGGAEAAAEFLVDVSQGGATWVVLAVLLVGTMFLSDIVNNAASAVLMAPIAVRIADALAASPDPFLMAVAVGASSAFLTPIGHQSNILVMGPGGYRFGDYWRMGLPLELLLVAVAVPLILLVWPP